MTNLLPRIISRRADRVSILDRHASASKEQPLEVIRIIVACDESYAIPAAVSIRSLLDHYTPDRPLMIHVIDGGMSQTSRKKLSESCGHRVEFISPRAAVDMRPSEIPYPASVCLRLEIPFLFPDFRRAIYLDSDILVRDCISKLWDIEIPDDVALGAVFSMQTPRGHRVLEKFGFTQKSRNFNSGILVMNNLELLRKTLSPVFQMLVTETLLLPDQDALNLHYQNWYSLPPRWNRQQFPNEAIYGTPSAPWRLAKLYTEEEIADMLEHPAIIHYTTELKPWHVGAEARLKWAPAWRQVAETLAWSREELDSYYRTVTLQRMLSSFKAEAELLTAMGLSASPLNECVERIKAEAARGTPAGPVP